MGADGGFRTRISRDAWQLHENIVTAKAPIDWTKLSIQPLILQAKANQDDAHTISELQFENCYPSSRGFDAVHNPLGQAIGFMARSINYDQASKFQGLCYGCYDLTNKGYRLPSWVWTSGIVIRAFLETGRGELISLADKIGNACLRFRIEGGPNAGAFMIRYDPATDVEQGYTAWLSPNDAALLGGYGFLPLFKITGEHRFWEAAVSIADWILREGITNGRLRVGYRLECNLWEDSWLYVDAGFTNVLFACLHEMEPIAKWHNACVEIMEDLIARFYARRGRLYSAWLWPGRRGKLLFARGYAWFLDGLIHSWVCSKQTRFLKIATQCAEYVMRYQQPNGGWYYLLDKAHTGLCNKGTPAIAWQLLRLFEHTEDERLRSSARHALDWCASHQYYGDDTKAKGGIVAWNIEGSIIGAKSIETAFPYASAFQVLTESLYNKLL